MVVYRPQEFAALIGKSTSTSTLRRWDREGTLPAKRGKGNQRYYTDEDIANPVNVEEPSKQGKTVVYYRVSTHVQKVDLEHQRQAFETYALNAGIAVDEWVKDLGSGLNFKSYGKEWLESALTPTKYPDGKPKDGKQKYRTGTKQPVTYELVRRDNTWYVNAIIDQPIGNILTSAANGVLGIDLNPTSIDWTIIERHGNLKRHGSIKINIQDKSSNQTEDILGKAIAEIVIIAQKYGVPIAIEDLDFTQKKAALKERSTKYARMLSNFAYSKFTQMIETRCIRQGVQLLKVEAAYTSIIGVTKYMALYGLNSGCAAALVIARRSQGRTEKLPASHARYFKKPEDRLKSGAWAKVSKKIKICGGKARNEFYHLRDKKVRTNCPLHGKLRQKPQRERWGNTVQVLRTPHINLKTSAVGSPTYLTVNG